MKKIIILLLLIFATTIGVAAQGRRLTPKGNQIVDKKTGWHFVVEDANSQMYFVDLSSIERTGAEITFITGYTYRKMAIYQGFRVNCETDEYWGTPIYTLQPDGSMEKRKSEATTQTEEPYKIAIKGETIVYNFIEYVCNK